MGGLQIRTWGFTHQLFKQTSSKDGRGHGRGLATLGPPRDLCSFHRLGWVLPALGPPLGHPSSCSNGSLCLFVLFHGLSRESDVGGISDTGGACHTGGLWSPEDHVQGSGICMRPLSPRRLVPLPTSPTLRGQAIPLPWERVALAWGGGRLGHMCENTL